MRAEGILIRYTHSTSNNPLWQAGRAGDRKWNYTLTDLAHFKCSLIPSTSLSFSEPLSNTQGDIHHTY